MKKKRRLAIYLLSFGFARGALFGAPILLANLLPSHVYGLVEWAHATASLGVMFGVMGTSAAIPLIVLKKIQKGTMTGVLAHHILLVFVCLTFMICVFRMKGGEVFSIAALLVAAISLQGLWSTHFKTLGKSNESLLLDSGLFVMMVSAAWVANYLNAPDPLPWLLGAVAIYVSILFSNTVIVFFRRFTAGETISYREVLVLGLPLMIATLVSVMATTSGRIMIGYLGGTLLTADYAILARVAALPIVAHQVIIVAKFPHLFTLPDREMERVVILIIGLVALSVVGFWLVSPFFDWMLGPVFVKAFHRYPEPAIWILSQSILWSGIALHDTINTRHQTLVKVLPWSIIFLVVSLPVAMISIQYVGVTLPHFVYLHGVLMLLFYLNQILAMYRVGIRLMKVWVLSVCSYLLLIMLASWVY